MPLRGEELTARPVADAGGLSEAAAAVAAAYSELPEDERTALLHRLILAALPSRQRIAPIRAGRVTLGLLLNATDAPRATGPAAEEAAALLRQSIESGEAFSTRPNVAHRSAAAEAAG